MTSDAELLRNYAKTRDEACFAEIVQRHVRFVHAVSRRRLGDNHTADDATQAVFVALARKAASVAGAPSVVGWLHRSACYETRNVRRAQTNLRARETEAHHLGTTVPQERAHLTALDAILDDVLCELSDKDRQVILDRYFASKSYSEVGAEVGLSENAARMRVERALGKLRDLLERRGVTSTLVALGGALPAYASAGVPSGLAGAVTKAALAAAAAHVGTAVALTFMSTAKVVMGIAVVVAVGGLWFAYRHTADLQAELTTARAENAAISKKLDGMKGEIAVTKRQLADMERLATSVPPTTATAATVTASAPSPGMTPKAPKGWFKNGSANDLFEVGVDENTSWGGMPSAYARSLGAANGQFGGMMQSISAETYKNQRVRLTGWVKTENANEGGGHLWMRVDGQERGKSVQFDNMDGRAPKGTTDWQEYSIVLDVPPDATRLNYGFFVGGQGKMWVNGVTITPVGSEVASTNLIKPAPPPPSAPVNLGFAQPQP